MHAFYNVRIDFYAKRRVHLINKLTEDWEKLDNKVITTTYKYYTIYNYCNLLLLLIGSIHSYGNFWGT
jgi:hypothetical protein